MLHCWFFGNARAMGVSERAGVDRPTFGVYIPFDFGEKAEKCAENLGYTKL
jgi:hypothetical protein